MGNNSFENLYSLQAENLLFTSAPLKTYSTSALGSYRSDKKSMAWYAAAEEIFKQEQDTKDLLAENETLEFTKGHS